MVAKHKRRASARIARKDHTRSRILTELLQVSESDVRQAIVDTRVRIAAKRHQPLPASDVVARILADRLVRKLPPVSVRITKFDLHGLSRQVENVLDNKAVPRSVRIGPRMVDTSRSRTSQRPRPTGRRYATTALLPNVTDDDVRRAAKDVQSRTPKLDEPAGVTVSQVVTDLLAVHLASHLKSDPDTVNVHSEDVRGLTEEVEAVLAAGPQVSPWRAGIGPVLRSETACAVLGLTDPEDLRRQATAKLVLVLRTSDGHDVLPCYQFAADGMVPGFSDVLKAITAHDQATWTAASWLRTPLRKLGNRSIIDTLRSGDVRSAVEAARQTAARWAV